MRHTNFYLPFLLRIKNQEGIQHFLSKFSRVSKLIETDHQIETNQLKNIGKYSSIDNVIIIKIGRKKIFSKQTNLKICIERNESQLWLIRESSIISIL